MNFDILSPVEREKMRETQLLPVRHPQGELFLCDLGDVSPKDDQASMEHPIFALSTKPDTQEKLYEHCGNTLKIIPSSRGMATIYDKDILIFIISQIMAAKNKGLPYSKKVEFDGYDYLIFSNKMTNGNGYKSLSDGLSRLRGTTLETTILTNNIEQTTGFGLIEDYQVCKKKKDGTIVRWQATISEWLYNAIESHDILTLSKEYFRLRKPIERRIYEIARKHCGKEKEWKINIPLLMKKTGSQTNIRKFRQLLAPIMEADHLPDYSLEYSGNKNEFVLFKNRKFTDKNTIGGRIILHTDTYEQAKQAAPSWDIYLLEQEWRAWINSTKKTFPANPDKAFIGFCKSWYKRKGRA